MKRLDSNVTAPGISFKEATRETPDMHQSLAIVPLSLGVGFVILLGGFGICWWLKRPIRDAFGIAGLLMIACVLFAFWRIWADQLYMAVETIIGHDINQDGFIGPPPEPRQVSIEISNTENNNRQYLELPDTIYEKLPMIAHLLQAGKPFSEGSMTGEGRPLSRAEFHKLRDVMFSRGLAAWRNPKHPTQGVILTAFGRSVMRKMLDERTTHVRMRTPRTPAALPPGSVGEWEGD